MIEDRNGNWYEISKSSYDKRCEIDFDDICTDDCEESVNNLEYVNELVEDISCDDILGEVI